MGSGKGTTKRVNSATSANNGKTSTSDAAKKYYDVANDLINNKKKLKFVNQTRLTFFKEDLINLIESDRTTSATNAAKQYVELVNKYYDDGNISSLPKEFTNTKTKQLIKDWKKAWMSEKSLGSKTNNTNQEQTPEEKREILLISTNIANQILLNFISTRGRKPDFMERQEIMNKAIDLAMDGHTQLPFTNA